MKDRIFFILRQGRTLRCSQADHEVRCANQERNILKNHSTLQVSVILSAVKEPSGNSFCSSFYEWKLLSKSFINSMKLKEQLRQNILINISPIETKQKEPDPKTGKTLKFKNDLC